MGIAFMALHSRNALNVMLYRLQLYSSLVFLAFVVSVGEPARLILLLVLTVSHSLCVIVEAQEST